MTRQELEKLLHDCPFHRFLGMQLDAFDTEAGTVAISLPLREEFSRANGRVELHGGITAALIDIAGDYAVAIRISRGVPTINLRIDYLKMGRGDRIVARARAIRIGRSIGTVDIEVEDATGTLIAVGRGTYSTAEPPS